MKLPIPRVYKRKLGSIRLKRFVGMIYKLLLEEQKHFDIVLVGGNSGWMMGRITQEIFDKLNVKRPQLIAIPFVKYKPDEKGSLKNFIDIIQEEIRDQIGDSNLKDFKNVLFVDDEIGDGCTADVCIEALLKATVTDSKMVNYYIVAEDHGFKASNIKNVNAIYYPFARKIMDLNNIISYCIPADIDRQIRKVLPDDLYHAKKRFNVLLDLPSLDKKQLFSNYNYQLNETVRQNISNIEELKTDFKTFLSKLISNGIEEYKKGEIKFKNDNKRQLTRTV